MFTNRDSRIRIGIDECMNTCKSMFFSMMGYQNNLYCYCGLSTDDYKKHGSSDACTVVDAQGRFVGGNLASSVYRIGGTQFFTDIYTANKILS